MSQIHLSCLLTSADSALSRSAEHHWVLFSTLLSHKQSTGYGGVRELFGNSTWEGAVKYLFAASTNCHSADENDHVNGIKNGRRWHTVSEHSRALVRSKTTILIYCKAIFCSGKNMIVFCANQQLVLLRGLEISASPFELLYNIMSCRNTDIN